MSSKMGSTYLVYYNEKNISNSFSTSKKVNYRFITDCYFMWTKFEDEEYKMPFDLNKSRMWKESDGNVD